MSYIGNTPTQQAFTPAIDYFSGNGSTTAFTLSRPVASVAQIQAVIENVPQNPSSAYTVSGNTITFTSAPPSGTNNIYVEYTSPITQVVALPQNPQVFGNLQFSSAGGRITGDFSNATVANRVMFQSSTTNGNTTISVIPNGTNAISGFNAFNNSDPTNASVAGLSIPNGVEMRLVSGITGTGSYLPMTFYTSGSERMRIDTSGNVGIGGANDTSYGKFQVLGSSYQAMSVKSTDASGVVFAFAANSSNEARINTVSNHPMVFYTNNVEQVRVTTDGLFKFNSGYGSAATAYGCRAWVNFNGTGTVAIRSSGNVSSITDNGTGDYTVNFSTAMPDANYAFTFGGTDSIGNNAFPNFDTGQTGTVSTTQLQVRSDYQGTFYDALRCCVSVFR